MRLHRSDLSPAVPVSQQLPVGLRAPRLKQINLTPPEIIHLVLLSFERGAGELQLVET